MPFSPSQEAYLRVRARTLELVRTLSTEDCCVQSMPDASPAKWHLGHTTWFFETFVLERRGADFSAFDPAFRVLFNSYYNAVGAKHPRPERGLLTRPALERVLAYRAAVDEAMLAALARPDAELLALTELGLHHEQQHQELLLTDIKHLFSRNPLRPAYQLLPPPAEAAPALAWHGFAGGLSEIGYRGEGFCYDNETPRHQVYLEDFQLASRLVTNGEYAVFIAAGGYAEPEWWLSEGWEWRSREGREHPLYWQGAVAGWQEFSLGGQVSLDPNRPVTHVSYYEADAYARWSQARLPTEAEWEHAATQMPVRGHFSDSDVFHPGVASEQGLTQLYGDAWEWTSSSYAAYPGFRISPGAVGEYNGKFMVNQYVLKGGSCATPHSHIRASYRNFFPAATCWQFSGIRLARDC